MCGEPSRGCSRIREFVTLSPPAMLFVASAGVESATERRRTSDAISLAPAAWKVQKLEARQLEIPEITSVHVCPGVVLAASESSEAVVCSNFMVAVIAMAGGGVWRSAAGFLFAATSSASPDLRLLMSAVISADIGLTPPASGIALMDSCVLSITEGCAGTKEKAATVRGCAMANSIEATALSVGAQQFPQRAFRVGGIAAL